MKVRPLDVLCRIELRLDRIDWKLNYLLQENRIMALDLNELTAEVSADVALDSSAVTLINRIADELANTGGDQAAVDALAQQLRDGAAPLAAAVVANTPAAPTPDA